MTGLQGLQFWSHVHREEEDWGGRWFIRLAPGERLPPRVRKSRFRLTTVAQVRQDPGYEVSRFPDVVRYVSELASCNTRFNLLFRGQNEDYLDSNGRTKLYPTIFRPDKNRSRVHKTTIRLRFKDLRRVINTLRANRYDLKLNSHLVVYPEYWLSLLQHYGICSTPLLDLTQSLRVATSFALLDLETGSLRERGYLYVLGMPHLHGCISAFADHRMTIVKLQSVSPPQALRPHFQEGYLVGRWPRTESKEAQDNFAYWLVGKYMLDNTGQRFFEGDFPAIPQNALLPERDPFKDELRQLYTETKRGSTSTNLGKSDSRNPRCRSS